MAGSKKTDAPVEAPEDGPRGFRADSAPPAKTPPVGFDVGVAVVKEEGE